MPRAQSYRRQEIRHLRRLARRSLNHTALLDDDLIATEDWAEPRLPHTMSDGDVQELYLRLAPDDDRTRDQ
jgi:hypothetical protein